MSSDDRPARDGRDEDSEARGDESQGKRDDLVQFVRTTGTQVTGRHRDKPERIAETVSDLELACEGAFSLAARTERGDRVRWGAALARACSVFLRKMVIGDRNDPATRLLDDSVLRTFGVGFARLRRIPRKRRTIEVGWSMPPVIVAAQKRDKAPGSPEATHLLPIAPHTLRIAIEWPLPGAASWTSPPTVDRPWTMAPGELFALDAKGELDCSAWLGQQLVMLDQRGITLKDVLRTVVTFEGAHSISVSRLLHPEGEQPKGPFRNPERHILDNVTVFGMKYTHLVVIESALYLYEMLADGGHIARLGDDKWRLRPSFVAEDEDGFFSGRQGWLGYAGGLIPGIGTPARTIAHRIRAVG
ncbi:MAG: hypothetical protein OXG58_05990 [Gemmatimonadetes bacterium]|nr:hypothetical protein [Gemmatimonadota bacterium]